MTDFTFDPIDKIEREAKSYNCEVVIASDSELQFDLDNSSAVSQFRNFYKNKLVNYYGGDLPLKVWYSKNGNTHAVVTLPTPQSVEERIAMQVMGGSDVGREFAALCCHWAGSPHPILLFKPIPKDVQSLLTNILTQE